MKPSNQFQEDVPQESLQQHYKSIIRKLDIHIVSWLFALWLLAFIDRTNIGNARIDGMVEELGLASNQFNISLAVFYIPYVLYDVQSNLVMKKLRPGLYLPSLVVLWGIISIGAGFVKSYQSLLAVRVFLGLAESGLLGGAIVYLASFYPRRELLCRIGMFYCAAPLSGAFGGLLATGLAKIETSRYLGWSFIFFIEGAMTVVVGAAAMCVLPDSLEICRFLDEDEKRIAMYRLASEQPGQSTEEDSAQDKFRWREVKRAILNWETLILSFAFFAVIAPIYSFTLFLPTIIRDLGYSSTTAQLFSVPPNIGGFLSVLLISWLSDKYRMRGLFMVVCEVLAIIGYIMLMSSDRGLVRYGGTSFVAAGIFPCSLLVLGWLANNLMPHYVRATGTGFQLLIGNTAAFIATFTYLDKDAPRYVTGHAINLGMLVLALGLTVGNLAYVSVENRKRQEGGREYRLEAPKTDLGYLHPDFRYTLYSSLQAAM